MPHYTRKDFKVFIETKYNKYSDKYLHAVRIHKILENNKYENIDMYSSTIVTDNIEEAINKMEEFEKNFIVASSIEINLNYPLGGENRDTVWLVDFDKNIVKCLNGVTGAESYHIDTILKHGGSILVPCAGTKGSWNRLEIDFIEFKEQLENIIKENNKCIARKELHKINSEMITEEIINDRN